jgi:uncharacterized protein (DUF433 family)
MVAMGAEPGDKAMTEGAKATKLEPFERITFDPDIMGGRACIRGMRVTVAAIVGQVAEGASIEDILADYPYLERQDVEQALAYAAWLASEQVIPA